MGISGSGDLTLEMMLPIIRGQRPAYQKRANFPASPSRLEDCQCTTLLLFAG